MIQRSRHLSQLRWLLSWNPIVALLGARQVGKTTLARELASGESQPVTFFDLENPTDLAALSDPFLVLKELQGLIVLDEVHHRPDLFPVLRVLADRPQAPARFLILGSASPELLRQGSETLAGRVAFHELPPLTLDETGAEELSTLWRRGGFPRSFLAGSDAASAEWRRGFVRTFLERDIPAFGLRIPPATLERFWSMLAHYHGELWNGAELARNFAVTANTVRHYLDILTATFLVRQLQPWHENLGKRQVRSPKIYFRDTGLLHTLLHVDEMEQLIRHPKVGASWEGFALEEVANRLGAELERCHFWRTHAGAELDLLVHRGHHRFGFEFKRTTSPKVTPGMLHALADLDLERLDVVYAGERTFALHDKIRALPLARIWTDLEPLRESPAAGGA